MEGIVQHALQYDMFYGAGAMLLTALSPVVEYWQPIPRKPLHSDQHAVIITVTKTATATSKPSTITATIPTTVYATVTNQVTRVSRHIQYLTTYTHYPIDTATPCVTTTHTYSFSPVATPLWNATTGEVISPDAPTVCFSRGWTLLILLSMCTAASIYLLYYIFSAPTDDIEDRLEIVTFHRDLLKLEVDAEKDRYQIAMAMKKEMETHLVQMIKDKSALNLRVKVTNILFQKLGVYEEDSGQPDNETLVKLVEAKIDAISALRLEMEEKANANSLFLMSASRLEMTIRERLNSEWNHQFSEKQRELDHWRHYFTQNATEAMMETERRSEETDRLREDTRCLREETERLRENNKRLQEEINSLSDRLHEEGL